MYRRRERGLEDVYGATIERIKAQGGDKSRLGMGVLMWICHAERPLRPKELCHALEIELGSTDFNAGNIPSIMTLVGCCQGLIIVDKEESRMRLIHFTLREYVSAHPDIFSRPHSAIAEICLTYLNCQQVKTLSVATQDDVYAIIHNQPFLAYCSQYWGVHVKKELSDYAMSLSLRLVGEYDGHISVALLFEMEWGYPEDHSTGSLWNGLHCASYFGVVEVVATLVEMGCYDLNEGDCWGFTALALAAWMGHEGVVKILLRRADVNPDQPDSHGQTPLSRAAESGMEEVVKILLGREDVNPDEPDNNGRTPLAHAAQNGREEVVKILLGREEVDPDKPDYCGRTPLSWAAELGKEEVVKILLGRGEVNPDKPDFEGQTPLMRAASWGKRGMVALLKSHKAVTHTAT